MNDGVTTTVPPTAVSGGVRPIRLDVAGVPLSGLLGEPEWTSPRGVVVALHGAGMTAGYFHGRAHPDQSLAELGRSLGFTVLALDRPGYGASSAVLPHGQSVAEQAALLRGVLAWYADRHAVGAGFFLLAHSYGGKVALTAAAQESGDGLIGLDISGCGHEYLPDHPLAGPGHWRRHWGSLRCYPPNTFRLSELTVAPIPERELAEVSQWPEVFATVAARVRVPVRFTFAQYEGWWRHDEPAVADLVSRFTGTPRVVVDRQPDSGHNISLGWAARAYHLRAIGFLEECLAAARCRL
ncbi:alpha/beta fold hydrolase [Solwaraspora sp. WMMD406]|uniref:alpha/beta hydrolase n=1 Tax=Solwaraspora sp. WMMD406 TaxID=3016095 RepID=UPI0024166930|nr:alpha/beta hydrolase [Solwaraspora sp. WMMD406]MDG4765850.1 alpha/beta fold hydrolase [Solwaraspora sp. WMMD406]